MGMFQVYEAAKKHSLAKPNLPIALSHIPQDPSAQQEWFKSKYKEELAVCAPQAKPILDPSLIRLANYYQHQGDLVKLRYPNADKDSREVVTQNYFYTHLTNLVIRFSKYYDKDSSNSYDQINYIKSLKNKDHKAFFIAALYQIGDIYPEQEDTFNSIINTRDVAKRNHLLETKYGLNPSVQIAEHLLINQYSELDEIKNIKQACFNILANHPSSLENNISR